MCKLSDAGLPERGFPAAARWRGAVSAESQLLCEPEGRLGGWGSFFIYFSLEGFWNDGCLVIPARICLGKALAL